MFEPLEEGLWLWRSQGESLRRRLMEIWEEEHAREKFSVVSSPVAFIGEGGVESITQAHKEYFFRCGVAKIAEVALVSSSNYSDPALGLFSPKAYFADRSHLFCPDDKLLEECISSLHFIRKIPKILGFEFEIVLSILGEGTQKAKSRGAALFREALEKAGIAYTVEKNSRSGILASIDVRIPDALGRRWTGPYLRIPEAPMPVGKGSMLIRSAFGSLERIAALLMEQKRGSLPLRLAPEQVRILAATGRSLSYAKQVRQGLLGQGIRATLEDSGEMLKVRVYKAMAEKVPYVVLLGEREEKGKTLTVRAYEDNKEQVLSLDEFCMRLKSEMGS
jgi:threonyl-tRNA synthetase